MWKREKDFRARKKCTLFTQRRPSFFFFPEQMNSNIKSDPISSSVIDLWNSICESSSLLSFKIFGFFIDEFHMSRFLMCIHSPNILFISWEWNTLRKHTHNVIHSVTFYQRKNSFFATRSCFALCDGIRQQVVCLLIKCYYKVSSMKKSTFFASCSTWAMYTTVVNSRTEFRWQYQFLKWTFIANSTTIKSALVKIHFN